MHHLAVIAALKLLVCANVGLVSGLCCKMLSVGGQTHQSLRDPFDGLWSVDGAENNVAPAVAIVVAVFCLARSCSATSALRVDAARPSASLPVAALIATNCAMSIGVCRDMPFLTFLWDDGVNSRSRVIGRWTSVPIQLCQEVGALLPSVDYAAGCPDTEIAQFYTKARYSE